MRARSGDAKGRRAEWRAEIWLRLKGYRIVARRFRSGLGEVDLIAQRGRVLAFVEVKHRASLDAALEAVDARKRRRVTAAAHAFLAARPSAAVNDCRFDVVLVPRGGLPRHVLNAWSASDHNG